MQGKGFVRIIALLLVAICTYQLLFTWKANQIEKQAVSLAEANVMSQDPNVLFPDDPIQQFLYKDSIHKSRVEFKNRYLDSLAPEVVFLGSTFRKVKENQLSLGLDLQGGMSAVLQVNIRELLTSLSDNNTSPVFLEALNIAESKMSESTDDFITLFVKALKEKNPTAKLAYYFANRNNSDVIKSNSTDEEVLKYIRDESGHAIQRTYNIISTRVDQFGLMQPNITLEPRKGRITVEIGGVDNPARIRKMLQATASLEFWETYKANEIGGSFNDANEALKLHLQFAKSGKKDTSSVENSEATTSTSQTIDDILGTSTKTDDTSNTALTKSPLDSIAEREKAIEDFPLFSVLIPAIDQNNQFLASPVIGSSLNIDTAKVNSYLNVANVKGKFPKDVAFMWSAKPRGDKNNVFDLYAIKKRPNTDKPYMDGAAVVSSNPDLDQFGNVTISMKMSNEGASKWKKMTGSNVGRNIAIVVDDAVYSAPNVNEEIGGGSSSISGAFTQEEATDLSNILKIGKLPASATIVEEEMVGATLGSESIQAGLLSMLAGFGLVVAFVMFFYSTGGVIATIVLIFNMFLIIGIMATMGSTLTLPGIAGIVLTMGMAVDANVLIYERIKEELRLGHALSKAISNGFKFSLPAIIDSNVTTMITGLILFFIGMGPIKGFATTLIIGILTTLFTALLISRLMIERWMSRGNGMSVSTKLTENFLTNTNFDFFKRRKINYIISFIIIALGFVSFATKGFELGVDFVGGREYKVRFEQPVSAQKIKSDLDGVFGGGTIVKTIGSENQFKITTSYLIDKNSSESDHMADEALFNGVKEYLPAATTFENFKQINLLSQQKVDPTISVDIIKSSTWAVVLSILGIFFYILIRFRSLGYSLGAIISTAHDAILMLVIFSIFHGILPFSLEINQTFIAAILTVIGYSLNDTVIIYDRLREYLGEKNNKSMTENMNNAINSTLSRTFNTSFTTLITLTILFIFGGESLRSFSFAMMIGVLIGTYSSIFVAAPIMFDFERFRKKKNA
ncbi:MAG TPA: protein translocase subunit SecDF [Chitinophagales bacterium]|nr:protein translocase subunit SecDF [Chitinophagales bacterium]